MTACFTLLAPIVALALLVTSSTSSANPTKSGYVPPSMSNFKDIPADAIRGIAAPTLVINGDNDVVRPEHAIALMRLLPHAQVAVLPGTDHMAIMTRADSLVPMINSFLDSAPAK